MLKTNVIVGILLVVASAYISNRLTSLHYTEKNLEIAQQALQQQLDNQSIAQEISRQLEDDLQKYSADARPITKEIIREVTENHIYSDCKSTDGFVRNYNNKLSKQ